MVPISAWHSQTCLNIYIFVRLATAVLPFPFSSAEFQVCCSTCCQPGGVVTAFPCPIPRCLLNRSTPSIRPEAVPRQRLRAGTGAGRVRHRAGGRADVKPGRSMSWEENGTAGNRAASASTFVSFFIRYRMHIRRARKELRASEKNGTPPK